MTACRVTLAAILLTTLTRKYAYICVDIPKFVYMCGYAQCVYMCGYAQCVYMCGYAQCVYQNARIGVFVLLLNCLEPVAARVE